uniref:Beta-1,4-glucuronyltransferase 1 n=1 Tax=Phallusia mammillata TaxID=59560 RepID=A0A6F9D7X5_9ASCI|nr:beta-1,4-glucuronyltransferase 1-like [Phallusia mammillata]
MIRKLFCWRKLWKHKITIATITSIVTLAYLTLISNQVQKKQNIHKRNAQFKRNHKSVEEHIEFKDNNVDSRGQHYIHTIYSKSALNVDVKDVTLSVHLGINELPLLSRLAATWSCPISSAVFVDEAGYQTILKTFLGCHVSLFKHVTIRMVRPVLKSDLKLGVLSQETKKLVDSPPYGEDICKRFDHLFESSETNSYPVNLIRNIAMDGARTRFVLNSDVTFLPSKGACNELKEFLNTQFSDFETFDTPPKRAFVLPVYEIDAKLGLDSTSLTKQQLLSLWSRQKARPYLESACQDCHKNTDHSRWQEQKAQNAVYLVQWSHPYEPYFVAMREALPRFDERFESRGHDRLSQTCEMFMSDWEFYVLGTSFLVHPGFVQSHSNLEIDSLHQMSQAADQYNDFIKLMNKKYPTSNRTCEIPLKFTL